ncbi:DUF6461 domain-containing protein [Streptomyces sp. YS-3]
MPGDTRAWLLCNLRLAPKSDWEKPLSTGDLWWAREDVVCLSITRDRTVAEVLTAYGASQDEAEHLTLQQARDTFPGDSGVVLRAGQIETWAFCHEAIGEPEGHKEAILAKLSEGTETVLYFAANGMTVVHRLVDGSEMERFEPGNPHTLRASGQNPLWDSIHSLTSHPTSEQIVRGIESYLSVRIDSFTLSGPLTTVRLRNDQRVPIHVQDTRPTDQNVTRRAGLGGLLGSFQPDDITWPKKQETDGSEK